MEFRSRWALLGVLVGVFMALITGSAALASPAPLCMNPAEAKSTIRVAHSWAEDGTITRLQANDGVRKCLQHLSKMGYAYTERELLTMPDDIPPPAPKLSGAQRFVGMITFSSVGLVLSILGIVVGLSYLLFAVLKKWRAAFEPILGLMSFGTFIWAIQIEGDGRSFVALLSCLLFGVALTLGLRGKPNSGMITAFILFIAWSTVAMGISSSLIGFFAVGALMVASGFVVDAFGLGYAIGFKDDKAIVQGTLVAFGVLTAFVVMRVQGSTVTLLEPFETGSLFLGSFVGYLGLLIMSSKKYACDFVGTRNWRVSYFFLQLFTMVMGVASLAIGSVFQIGELQKIGGTFFVFYLLEKLLFDIKFRDNVKRSAWLLFICILTAAGFFYVIEHPEPFRNWLIVVG